MGLATSNPLTEADLKTQCRLYYKLKETDYLLRFWCIYIGHRCMYVRTVLRTVRGSNKKKVFSSCSRLIIPYNIRYPIEVLALHLTNNDFGINSLASFFSKLLTNYLEIYHKPSLESLTKRWRVGSISYCNHIGNLIKGLSALRIHRKKVVLFNIYTSFCIAQPACCYIQIDSIEPVFQVCVYSTEVFKGSASLLPFNLLTKSEKGLKKVLFSMYSDA